MNALQIDEKTGFLDADNVNAFTPERKTQFLELCRGFRAEGKFPKVGQICEMVGIHLRTFERHIAADEKFKSEWNEIASSVEYECISDMYELRKKNPMFMFGMLRYLNPARWSPTNNSNNAGVNVSIFVDNMQSKAPLVDTVAE